MRIVLGLCVALTLLHAIPIARSQSGLASLLTEAKAELKQGNFQVARELFERVHQEHTDANTWVALGLCDFHLANYVQAISELETALTERRDALNNAQTHEVNGLLDQARVHVGRLIVATIPTDAALTLDGRVVDARQFWLDGSEHALRATAPDYQMAESKVSVSAGSVRHELLTLGHRPISGSTTPVAPAQTAPKDQRIIGTWWFWAALGAVVIGAGAATTIAISTSGPTYVRHDFGPHPVR